MSDRQPDTNGRRHSILFRLTGFLLFISSLLFNIATMHSFSSKSLSDAAYPDYPIYFDSPEKTTSQNDMIPYINNNKNNLQSDIKLLPTAATHPRGPTPFNCGVVFFYHIPSTGGKSIAEWLRKYARPRNGNITFYQKWQATILRDGQFRTNNHEVQDDFIKGMNSHVENLGPNEWRSGQYHLANPPLNSTEHLWYQWRDTVEKQGCQMVNAIMLRDPLNHAMSLYKIMARKNSTREEWMDHLKEPSGSGKWHTVLDFFLYNIIGDPPRNPYGVTKEEKVRRGIELLQRHFDVVSLGDHSEFVDQVIDFTGWTRLEMPHTNVFKKDLNFTKKEVETLHKLLVMNGDIDFADAVKQRYSGHLSYLSDL